MSVCLSVPLKERRISTNRNIIMDIWIWMPCPSYISNSHTQHTHTSRCEILFVCSAHQMEFYLRPRCRVSRFTILFPFEFFTLFLCETSASEFRCRNGCHGTEFNIFRIVCQSNSYDAVLFVAYPICIVCPKWVVQMGNFRATPTSNNFYKIKSFASILPIIIIISV